MGSVTAGVVDQKLQFPIAVASLKGELTPSVLGRKIICAEAGGGKAFGVDQVGTFRLGGRGIADAGEVFHDVLEWELLHAFCQGRVCQTFIIGG